MFPQPVGKLKRRVHVDEVSDAGPSEDSTDHAGRSALGSRRRGGTVDEGHRLNDVVHVGQVDLINRHIDCLSTVLRDAAASKVLTRSVPQNHSTQGSRCPGLPLLSA